MGFFATRFLKQLEQNDKAPKQITSRYLSKQSSVLFNKDLPREFIPFCRTEKKRLYIEPKQNIVSSYPFNNGYLRFTLIE